MDKMVIEFPDGTKVAQDPSGGFIYRKGTLSIGCTADGSLIGWTDFIRDTWVGDPPPHKTQEELDAEQKEVLRALSDLNLKWDVWYERQRLFLSWRLQ
jgi:hypothetical protein